MSKNLVLNYVQSVQNTAKHCEITWNTTLLDEIQGGRNIFVCKTVGVK